MGAFATSKDAKKFLIERVREQAAAEGRELTPVEEHALAFSVEDVEIDEVLQAAFEREHRLDQFERKMDGLLERALERDRASRPDNAALWEDAYGTLTRGDHYILVVLKPVLRPGLGRRLRKALSR